MFPSPPSLTASFTHQYIDSVQLQTVTHQCAGYPSVYRFSTTTITHQCTDSVQLQTVTISVQIQCNHKQLPSVYRFNVTTNSYHQCTDSVQVQLLNSVQIQYNYSYTSVYKFSITTVTISVQIQYNYKGFTC